MNKVFIIIITLVFTSCSNEAEMKIIYHDNGKKAFEVPLENGLRNGKSKKYYKTGELQLISNWIKGLKEGASISYYKNGNIKLIENYKNGLGHGVFQYFDSTGNIVERICVRGGLENGVYKKYYSDGQLKVLANFKEGKKHGKVIIYDRKGNITSRVIYDSGKETYSVDYSKEGNISYSYFPTKITFIELDKNIYNIKIEILSSFFSPPRLGLIIGDLDENFIISDTTLITDTLGYEININSFNTKSKKITGIIFEVDPKRNEITNKTPIQINFESSF